MAHCIPNHDLPTFNHKLNPFTVSLGCDVGQEAVCGNPARATAEDIHSIDSEVERFAVLVRLLNNFGRPDAELLGFLNDGGVAAVQ